VNQRIFIKIPVAGDTSYIAFPEKQWKKEGLSLLYPIIDTSCVECFHPHRLIMSSRFSIWCDENGYMNQKVPNFLASRLHGQQRILGVALLELGTFDLDTTEGRIKFMAKLDKVPRWLCGVELRPPLHTLLVAA